jgi:hypothetical protein
MNALRKRNQKEEEPSRGGPINLGDILKVKLKKTEKLKKNTPVRADDDKENGNPFSSLRKTRLERSPGGTPYKMILPSAQDENQPMSTNTFIKKALHTKFVNAHDVSFGSPSISMTPFGESNRSFF